MELHGLLSGRCDERCHPTAQVGSKGENSGGVLSAQGLDGRSHVLKARPAHRSFTNQYVSLGDRVRFGDGCESEIDFLAQQLHLSPQAEIALRRGTGSATAGVRQKHSKATPYLKGADLMGTLKGQRDPMGHLAARTRWATYW